jgi:hypothetical protein
MNTYTYAYRVDSNKEIIGRVQATGLYEAREQIAHIKRLDMNVIETLFVIEKEEDHGKQTRTTSNI